MKGKKKLLAVIFVNIIFVLVVLVSIEYIIYCCAKVDYFKYHGEIEEVPPPPRFLKTYILGYMPQTIQYYNKNLPPLWIRPFSVDDSNTKPPILLFGCSFTNGTKLLKDEQTFGAKLSKMTKRNVYNFAMCCCGIQHMLFTIQKYLDKYLPQDISPEYAIYTYIPDHFYQRMRVTVYPIMFNNGTLLRYTFKNSKLVLEKKKFPLLTKSYIVKGYYTLTDKSVYKMTKENQYKNFLLANELFLESKKELEKRYPNIKFVIFRYQVENDEEEIIEPPFLWDVFKSEGFRIVNSSDLIGRRFRYHSEDTAEDGYHPSEAAWDLILPEFIKKLEL